MALDLQNTELGLIVARALGTPSVEILEVSAAALAAGGSQGEGGGLGIHHVTGVARTKAGLASWSMIVKALKGGSELGSDDPGSWNFWKREVLVNLTGLLEHLPAGIVAPRCYGVEERPDGECRIWMEEIQSTSSVWTMDRYTLAGRHLGQFNGAYLAGYPLPPAQPWMLSGRTRPWTMFIRPAAESSQQLADTPLARRWFGRDGLQRMLQIWARVEDILQAFERLPVCYCHHDAYRRNLLDRATNLGGSETVAIDWAQTGYGRVGEEIGVTIGVGLSFMEVPASQARELDQAVFSGYIDGLRDTGWRGEVRQARLGCVTNAVILAGLLGNLFYFANAQNRAEIALLEGAVHRSFDEIIEQYAEMLPFFIELGEEALTLLEV